MMAGECGSEQGKGGCGGSEEGRRENTCQTSERPPVPFPAVFPITLLLSLIPTPLPSPRTLLPILPPSSCPHAAASASSSQSLPRPCFRPSNPIRPDRSSTSSKQAKFLRHSSAFSFTTIRVPSHQHQLLEHMPPACLSIVLNNFNARSRARVVLIISKPLKVSDKRLRLCMQDSQSLSNLLYSRRFSGVRSFDTLPASAA